MFKKTISQLKEINESPKEIVVTTTVDSTKVTKNIVKMYAALIGIGVAGHLAIAMIDSKYPKQEKSQED
jgi:hypothetical protein